MKTLIATLVTSAAVLSIACGSTEVNTVVKTEVKPTGTAIVQSSPTPNSSPSVPQDGNYSGKGKVTKIDMKLGSIEIDHEEIAGLMPAMKMEFKVQDKTMLNELKAGDEVDFVLQYKHPTETLLEIKKNR